MSKLKNDKSFYNECSNTAKQKYNECFGEKQYIYRMKKVMKEVLESD